jgi:hypothetical protein
MTAAVRCPFAWCGLDRLALVLALFTAGACSSAADRHAQSDLTTRESRALSQSTLRSDDGVVLLAVPSQGPPSIRKEKDRYVVTVPIGAPQPVVCTISTDYQLLLEAVTGTFTAIPDPADRRLFAVEPLVLLDRPALFVALGFVNPTNGTAGVRKFEVFTVGGMASVQCTHDDAGYRETFRHVVEVLAGSLRITLPNAAPPSTADFMRSTAPNYQDIAAIQVATVPLGIEETRRYSLQDGETVIFRRHFELGPHGRPLTLAAREFSQFEVSDPDGRVALSLVFQARTEDGVTWERHSWTLRRGSNGYEVSENGPHRPPQRIADVRPLTGGAQRRRLVHESLLTGTQNTISVWDPPQLTWHDVTYTRLAASGADEHRLQRTDGDSTQVLVYDQSLCWIRSEPADPAVQFGYEERIFLRGSCKSD